MAQMTIKILYRVIQFNIGSYKMQKDGDAGQNAIYILAFKKRNDELTSIFDTWSLFKNFNNALVLLKQLQCLSWSQS